MSSRFFVIVDITISNAIDILKRTWFLPARKGSLTESSSALHGFDQDIKIGNTASGRQESVVVNEGTNDRDFTVGTSRSNSPSNENTVNVQTLERRFNEKIDKEKSNFVDTQFQNAVLTAIDNKFAPETELAIRSINASS